MDETAKENLASWKSSYSGSDYGKREYLKVKDGETVKVRILDVRPKKVRMCRIDVSGTRHPVTLSDDDISFIKKRNEKLGDKSKVQVKYRVALNVIDRRDGTVKIWEFSDHPKGPMGDLEGIVDTWEKLPTEFDVSIARKGTTQNDTTYSINIAPNQKPLTTEELALEKVDLSEYYKPNRERLESLLRGEVPKRKEDTNGNVETKEETTTVSATQENPLEDGESNV